MFGVRELIGLLPKFVFDQQQAYVWGNRANRITIQVCVRPIASLCLGKGANRISTQVCVRPISKLMFGEREPIGLLPKFVSDQ